MSLAIRSSLEAALLAYLTARVAAQGTCALTGVSLKPRQDTGTRAFPRVVLDALRAPQSDEYDGLYLIEFHTYCGTAATEAGATPALMATAPALQAARIGLLAEWLADKRRLLDFVNPGTHGVTGLVIHDIYLSEESGDQTADHWLDELTHTIVCQLRND